ncbi:MAG: Regulatory protein RecX [Eubacteriales bacterium SKADARSKE-1]|nr:Regulatory protein RecX [Eubacteriales bacterium SKADARSKE-1]
MFITKIKKCRKSQSSIYIDGEYFAQIDNDMLYLSNLKEGSEVDDRSLSALLQKSGEKRAKEKAFYILEHRSHSKKELIDKLKREYSEEVATKTAEKMQSLGLIDDNSFAKKYVEELLFTKHFSKNRAKYELVRKGIEKEIAEDLIDSFDVDEVEQIRLLVDKKYKMAYKDEKTKRRAIAFLQRYGYNFDDIRTVLANEE